MKKNKLILTILFLYSTIFSASIFAESVDVDATITSWTYNSVIKVELNATDAAAKSFYGFNPNWTPNDLLKYDWPILIKKSTPFIYWTFVDKENESKIKRNDYILNFTNDIRLWKTAMYEDWALKKVEIINNSQDSVDIGYWETRNDFWKVIIPEWTVLNAWWTYEVAWLSWTWIISLFAPDEEKKDFTEVQEIIKEVALVAPPKVIKKVAAAPRKVARIPKKTTVAAVDPAVDVAPALEPKTPTNDNVPPSSQDASPQDKIIAPAPEQGKAENNFNDSIKASAGESESGSGTAGKFIIIWVLAAAILGWAGMKFAKAKL
ncbi:MAG: hypothetical protein ACD_2C00193G0026 [uncultured bacterium (gcode 4)]|uniref:Uncharacterized protein n=1 Tax=uncultured bacterium (gcode 4) TaxID=1234023 RepID=K2H0I6_9BACT|nr:MAG: hypothetical protein ACD_2C00193G0026 [uncultured bacterium (gcode 4)]